MITFRTRTMRTALATTALACAAFANAQPPESAWGNINIVNTTPGLCEFACSAVGLTCGAAAWTVYFLNLTALNNGKAVSLQAAASDRFDCQQNQGEDCQSTYQARVDDINDAYAQAKKDLIEDRKDQIGVCALAFLQCKASCKPIGL